MRVLDTRDRGVGTGEAEQNCPGRVNAGSPRHPIGQTGIQRSVKLDLAESVRSVILLSTTRSRG